MGKAKKGRKGTKEEDGYEIFVKSVGMHLPKMS